MGARRDDAVLHLPLKEVNELMQYFHHTANESTPEEALAAFYAYESQVPRVAKEKERGLRDMYQADDKTCGYFTLHATADIYHSNVWRKQLADRLAVNPEAAQAALDAAEHTAKLLWQALDGIEAARKSFAA
jgi:pyrroloquinoline-quinone synthase